MRAGDFLFGQALGFLLLVADVDEDRAQRLHAGGDGLRALLVDVLVLRRRSWAKDSCSDRADRAPPETAVGWSQYVMVTACFRFFAIFSGLIGEREFLVGRRVVGLVVAVGEKIDVTPTIATTISGVQQPCKPRIWFGGLSSRRCSCDYALHRSDSMRARRQKQSDENHGQVIDDVLGIEHALRKRIEMLHAPKDRRCTRSVTGVPNSETQSSTHSSRQTANPATPATIWFLVQVEMNVPMASRHAALQQQPQIAHQQSASSPACRKRTAATCSARKSAASRCTAPSRPAICRE